MLELDDTIAATAPDLAPDEALAVDSQLDDVPSTAQRARRSPTGPAGSGCATWPKVAAVAIALLGLWQLVVWSGWRPEYVLPAARRPCSTGSAS